MPKRKRSNYKSTYKKRYKSLRKTESVAKRKAKIRQSGYRDISEGERLERRARTIAIRSAKFKTRGEIKLERAKLI